MLPTIVSFWHGELSWLERLAATSFVAAGHPVIIYSYESLADLPSGVTEIDAATILPRDQLVFYKGVGTPAVFSDRFRLELMRRGAGVWADLDMICLRPFSGLPHYVIGFERPGSINNAVLRLPPDSPLLAAMLEIFDSNALPRWVPFLPPMRRLEVAVRQALGEKLRPENMQFGATGPMPLTYYARRFGVTEVQPAEVFYPVPYGRVSGLLEPGDVLERHVTARTLGVHVWRSQLTDRGRKGLRNPLPGSALSALCQRFGIISAEAA